MMSQHRGYGVLVVHPSATARALIRLPRRCRRCVSTEQAERPVGSCPVRGENGSETPSEERHSGVLTSEPASAAQCSLLVLDIDGHSSLVVCGSQGSCIHIITTATLLGNEYLNVRRQVLLSKKSVGWRKTAAMDVYLWVHSQRAAATFMSIRGQGLPLSERLVDMNDEIGPTASHNDRSMVAIAD